MIPILRKVEQAVAAIPGHEHLLINAFDQDLRVVYWNEACEFYFGIPKDQAMGRLFADLLPKQSKDERVQLLKRALTGETILLLEQAFQRKPGFYDQELIPVKDEEGNVIAALNVVTDHVMRLY
jgi:PAS domain S-box-containing protein